MISETRYVCPHCHRSYIRSYWLVRHMEKCDANMNSNVESFFINQAVGMYHLWHDTLFPEIEKDRVEFSYVYDLFYFIVRKADVDDVVCPNAFIMWMVNNGYPIWNWKDFWDTFVERMYHSFYRNEDEVWKTVEKYRDGDGKMDEVSLYKSVMTNALHPVAPVVDVDMRAVFDIMDDTRINIIDTMFNVASLREILSDGQDTGSGYRHGKS